MLFSLHDGVEIECDDVRNGWHIIGVEVKVTADIKNWTLPKGYKLYACDGKYIGITLDSVPFNSDSNNGHSLILLIHCIVALVGSMAGGSPFQSSLCR